MGFIFGNKGDVIGQIGNMDFSQKDGKFVTMNHMGQMSLGSDGSVSTQMGLNMILQGGTGKNRVVTRMGNMWLASDGVTYTLVGNLLLRSDGRSWSFVDSAADAERIIKLDG